MNVTKSPLSVRHFIDWVAERLRDREGAEEFVQTEYLNGPTPFMSEVSGGDELLREIQDKLRAPFEWILEAASQLAVPAVPIWEFEIFIDPEFEEQTHILVVLGDRVILRETWNPWTLWWPGEG